MRNDDERSEVTAACKRFAQAVVILILAAMLPVALLALAGSGTVSTSNSGRVEYNSMVYFVVDLVCLGLLTGLHDRRWPWFVAAVMALAPLAVALTVGLVSDV